MSFADLHPTGLVDEGCADSDGDGVVDDLDNCPLLFNPEQGDGDQDMRGDACAEAPPPPVGLTAERIDGMVQLSWEPVDAPGIIGYNVYRRLDGEIVHQFMGEGWPVTAYSEFVDESSPEVSASYFVRAVNRYGLESEPSKGIIVTFGNPLYLPLIAHDEG